MSSRVVLGLPSHPFMLVFFALLALFPFAWLWVPGLMAWAFKPLGLSFKQGFLLASSMFAVSLALSFVNVVVKRVPRPSLVVVPEVDFVYVFGYPFPVPKLKALRREVLVAVNLGGAAVPLTVASTVALLAALSPWPREALTCLAASTAVAALASNTFARVVPGLGVACPAVVPPASSALAALASSLWLGVPQLAPAIAYAGAVYGALLGADVANLPRCLRDPAASMISIGGAGTFDGIYLGGLGALLLAFLLLP